MPYTTTNKPPRGLRAIGRLGLAALLALTGLLAATGLPDIARAQVHDTLFWNDTVWIDWDGLPVTYYDNNILNFRGAGVDEHFSSSFSLGTAVAVYVSGSRNYILPNIGININSAHGIWPANPLAANGKLVLGALVNNSTDDPAQNLLPFSGTFDITATRGNRFEDGIDIYTGKLRISAAVQVENLSKVRLLGDAANYSALANAISTNTGILDAVNTARDDDALATLVIAAGSTVTFDGYSSTGGTLSIDQDKAGSLHVETGATAEFTNINGGSVIQVFEDGLLALTADGDGRYKFTKNSSSAGAVVEIMAGATVYIEKADFDNTTLSNTNRFINVTGDSANGGATLVLNDVSFKNSVGDLGESGALKINGGSSVVITTATFSNNEYAQGGAIDIGDESSLKVTGAAFNDNTATNNGGAMHISKSTVDINASSFTGNKSKNFYGGGGALYIIDGSDVTINDSHFTGNQSENGYGGALYFGTSTVKIIDSSFSGNTAKYLGGALFVGEFYNNPATITLTISGTDFSKNIAKENGGALYIKDKSTVTITGGVFSENEADNGGGAIAVISADAKLTIDDAEFKSNTAVYGGALYIAGGAKLILNNSAVKNNFAGSNGGALYIAGGSEVDITGGELSENATAFNGGALYIDGMSTLKLTNTDVKNNLAANHGGALYITGKSVVNITGGEFSGNTTTSTGHGGAIYINDATVTVTDVSFKNNAADSLGGAVYLNGGTLNVHAHNSDVLFEGNKLLFQTDPTLNSIYIETNGLDPSSDQAPALTVDAAAGRTVDMRDPLMVHLGVDGVNVTITKTGQGTWKLAGENITAFSPNSASVIWTVAAGTLALDAGAGISMTKTASEFNLQSGAVLLAQGTNSSPNAISSNKITLANGSILRGGVDQAWLQLNAANGVELAGQVEIDGIAEQGFYVDAAFKDAAGMHGGLTITGGGVLLQQTSSYSGPTVITAAASLVNDSTAYYSSSSLFTVEGKLNINVNPQTIAGLQSTSTGGQVRLNNGLTVNQSVDTTYRGRLTGSGSFTKNGAGTLTLAGSGSDYSGNTRVVAGTLKAGAANAFSADSIFFLGSGATLDLAGFDQTLFSIASAGGAEIKLGSATLTIDSPGNVITGVYKGVISGDGGLAVRNGHIEFDGDASSYRGDTIIGENTNIFARAVNVLSPHSAFQVDGELHILADQTIGGLSGAGKIYFQNQGLTLTVNQSGDSLYSGVINDINSALVKNGDGKLTLSAAATSFTGAYTVNAGTLKLKPHDGYFTLSNILTGGAALAVELPNAMDDFLLADTVGTGFTGTLELEKGRLDLNANAAAALANATLKLSGGDSLAAFSTNRTIGNLEFNGGGLVFDPTGITPQYALTVGDLRVTGGGFVQVPVAGVIKNDAILDSLFDYAESAGAGQYKLVGVTGALWGGNVQLKLLDENGRPIAADYTRDLLEAGTYVGKASFGATASILNDSNHKGIYLGYGLTQIEVLNDKAVVLNTDKAQASTALINAKLTGAGSFSIRGSKAVEIGNAASDYTGSTSISCNPGNTITVTAISDNAFGNTSWLSLYNAKLDMNGKSQVIGSLMDPDGNSTIVLGALGITNGGVYHGKLQGANGILGLQGGDLYLYGSENTFGGPTIVDGGRLEAKAVNSFSPNSALVLNGGGAYLNNNNQTINGLSGAAGSELDLGGATLTVNQKETGIYYGALSGTGTLVKDTAGTNLTLGDISRYNGSFEIKNGTLSIHQDTELLLANNISGNNGLGTLAVMLGTNETALKFALNLLGFDGILQLAKGKVVLDAAAENFLRNAVTELLADGTLEITSDAALAELVFDGGTLNIINGQLQVNQLEVTGKGGTLGINLPGDIDINDPGAMNFFDYATAAGMYQQKVVGSNQPISGDPSQLKWVDTEGREITGDERIIDVLINDKAVGRVTMDYVATVKSDGVYLGYGLKAIDAFKNETVALDAGGALTGDPLLTAMLTGEGGFSFKGAEIHVGNSLSDYTGETLIYENTRFIAITGNPLGNTSKLVMEDNAVLDLGGYNQTLTDAQLKNTATINIGAGGTLTFNAGGNPDHKIDFGARLSGDGELKVNTNFNLTSDSPNFSGNITAASNSAVWVNGNLGTDKSHLNLTEGSSVLGNGKFDGNVLLNDGFIAPGNSIGTLTVGSLRAGALGGVLEVEVDPTDPNNADLLVVTGTADLSGITVRHVGLPETFGQYSLDGMQWRILTAGSITNPFDGVESDFWFLDLALEYDTNMQWADLKITRNMVEFAQMAETKNQYNTGKGLESLDVGTSDLIREVLQMTKDVNVPWLLDQLSGEIHAGTAGALQNYDRTFGKALRERVMLKDFAQEGYPLWVTFDAHAVNSQSTRNTGKTKFEGAGITLGTEAALSDNLVLGGAFRYGSHDVKLDSRNSEADIESYSVSLYGGWDVAVSNLGKLRFALGGAYGYHAVEAKRSIKVAPLNQNLKADYDADTLQFFGEAALGFQLTENFRAEPYVGVAWNSVHTESFREKGGTAALQAKSTTNDNLSSTLGLRAEYRPYNDDFVLRGDISWQHIYGDKHPEARLRFAGGSSFTIEGAPYARDALGLNFGAEVKFSDHLKMTGGYEGLMGSDFQSHGGKLNFILSF